MCFTFRGQEGDVNSFQSSSWRPSKDLLKTFWRGAFYNHQITSSPSLRLGLLLCEETAFQESQNVSKCIPLLEEQCSSNGGSCPTIEGTKWAIPPLGEWPQSGCPMAPQQLWCCGYAGGLCPYREGGVTQTLGGVWKAHRPLCGPPRYVKKLNISIRARFPKTDFQVNSLLSC